MVDKVTKRVLTLIAMLSVLHFVSFTLTNVSQLVFYVRSVTGFVILSIALGTSLRLFLRERTGQTWLPKTVSVEGFTLDVLVSSVFNILLSFILLRTGLFGEFQLTLLIDLCALALVAVTLFGIGRSPNIEPLQVERTAWMNFFPPIMLLISSVYFGLTFRSHTPYPTLSGWDINNALAYANWITQNKGFSFLLIPSFPAGSTPYSASFFILVSSFSSFLGLEPLTIVWLSVIPTIFLYMLLIYYVARKFSKNAPLSMISAFAAFYASVSLAEVVRNPLYLTPDMVAQLIFLLLLVFNIHQPPSNGKRLINILLAGFLLLFNYYTALAVSPFLAYFILEGYKLPLLGDGKSVFRLSIFAIILFFSIVPLFSTSLPLDIKPFFISSPFPQSLKTLILPMIYSETFLLLCIVGLAIFFYEKNAYSGGLSFFDFFLYTLMGGIIYFWPAWITYRIEFYFRLFLAVFISGIGLFLNERERSRTTHPISSFIGSHNSRVGLVAGYSLLLITVFIMNPVFQNYAPSSYFSKDEYDAATWLRLNTATNSYLVTDPSSGYLFRALSVRNASCYFILPDGRMPADFSTINPGVIDLTHNFFLNSTKRNWSELTTTVLSRDVYVLVTSRTAYWSTAPQDTVLTSPVGWADLTAVTDKLQGAGFRIVYSSKTVAIFKSPDSPV